MEKNTRNLLIVGALVVVGYFVWKNNKKKKSNKTSSNTPPSTTPSTTTKSADGSDDETMIDVYGYESADGNDDETMIDVYGYRATDGSDDETEIDIYGYESFDGDYSNLSALPPSSNYSTSNWVIKSIGRGRTLVYPQGHPDLIYMLPTQINGASGQVFQPNSTFFSMLNG